MFLLRQPTTHLELTRGLVFAGNGVFYSSPVTTETPYASGAVAGAAVAGDSRFARVLHGSYLCLSKPLNTTQQIGGVL
jgi:hypothetical protein